MKREAEREKERERERVSPDNHTKLNKNNFSEKIFLLKSSVGKKERTQFALSALGLGGEGTGRWVEVFQEGCSLGLTIR